jgi:hypothetical protein
MQATIVWLLNWFPAELDAWWSATSWGGVHVLSPPVGLTVSLLFSALTFS